MMPIRARRPEAAAGRLGHRLGPNNGLVAPGRGAFLPAEVLDLLRSFLMPALQAARTVSPVSARWHFGDGWR